MRRSGTSGTDGEPITSDRGIIKKITKAGSGDTIPEGMEAVVHYTGRLLNGTVFDSSKTR